MDVVSPPFSPHPFANQLSTSIKVFKKFWTQEWFYFPKEVEDGSYTKYLCYVFILQ